MLIPVDPGGASAYTEACWGAMVARGMGIYRVPGPSYLPAAGQLFTPGVVTVLACMLAGYILSVLAGPAVINILALTPSDLLRGRVWQVLTYWLVDGSGVSVGLNCIAVLLIGSAIERQWKARSLLALWMVTCVVTGLIWALVGLLCGRDYQGMTAAAGSFGLLAAFGLLFRGQRLLFPPTDVAVATWILIGIGVVLSLANPITLIWVLGAPVAYGYIQLIWRRARRSSPGGGYRPGRFVDLD